MRINMTNNNNYNSFNPAKKPYFGLNSNSSRGKDVSQEAIPLVGGEHEILTAGSNIEERPDLSEDPTIKNKNRTR